MRLLVVANWDWEGAPTPWATQRIARLRDAGVDVEVLAEPCVGTPSGYLRLWRGLDRRLRSGRYDLVAPLYGSVLGLLCAAQRRVPCVVSFAGSDLNLHGLRPAASQLAAMLADGLTVRTEKMRARLWWPPARRRARVIPSGVDTAHFRPLPRQEARRRRGLPVDGVRVLLVINGGADRDGKRPELAAAAVARLPGATLEVAAQVPFAEMPLVYASADALVLTSRNEGSPNCVKEALACAVPVVSVDVGDVREVTAGLRNCAVVAPDAAAISRALVWAIADGAGCPDGPARMAERHSLDAMVRRFADAYAQALTS
jgi:teichuronic acid biosynthesis glycosyltransferase TuaC